MATSGSSAMAMASTISSPAPNSMCRKRAAPPLLPGAVGLTPAAARAVGDVMPLMALEGGRGEGGEGKGGSLRKGEMWGGVSA